MRRIGLILIAALAAAGAGGGAAVLVAGEARAESPETTSATTTTGTIPSTTLATTTVATTTVSSTTRTTTTQPTTTVTSTRTRRPPSKPRRQRPKPGSRAGETTPPPPPPPATPQPAGRTPITRSRPRLGGGPYVFPVYGPVSFTDTFGAPRADTSWHHGDDIFAPLGAPVVAVAKGTVFLVGWNRAGGNRLWLRDRRGNYFYYAHLSAFSTLSTSGARVRAGTVLGFVGNTGDARGTPYHLHFEVHPVALIKAGYDASAVDPTPYLRAWKRAQAVKLNARDAKTTRAAGWSATVALPARARAPSAGAVLLQAVDISRAAGLRPKAVRQALVVPVHEDRVQPLWHAPEPAGVRPPRPLGRHGRKQARKAERLDRGAELPPGFGFPGMTVWDTLAQCEAGGDWTSNTGNGYYGGLQFAPGTWLAHGGGEFAPSAEQATREQQIIVAERVLRDQGWAAWPACSLKLGLRH